MGKLKKSKFVLLVALLIVLLVFTSASQVSAATCPITQFSFSINPPILAPSQTDVFFSGYLWCLRGGNTYFVPSGLSVELQISTSSSGPWTTAATTQTSSSSYSGTFTAPSTGGTYYYRGYFPTQTLRSNTYSEAISTPTWTVSVSYPTTTQLNQLPSILITNQPNTAYSGQVTSTPNVPNGASIKFQYSTSTTWYDFNTATTTNNNGQFSKTAPGPNAVGTVKVRATFTEYTTGAVWRTSTSSEQTIQMGYGLMTSTIIPQNFNSEINRQYTIRVTNLATNPSDRNIGAIQITIPTGYTVPSATINAQSKIWNTPSISGQTITLIASGESNRLTPGGYLDLTFTPTASPTTGTTFTWTTNAWLYTYALPFVVSGSQPQTTLVTPEVQSTSPAGTTKNEFNPTETISATGQYFIAQDTVDIYTTIHKTTWTPNDPLIDQSGNKETTTTNNDGVLETLVIWAYPNPGLYDIVVDLNQNGKYDAADVIDNLDVTSGESGGFFVVPEYTLGGLAALATCS